ncbi:MAG: xylulokinase [Clostridia bacterium]|nr:xylulokinase [Clostridia bacterium]
MKYLIGIDLGTSGTKTVLFDECGTVIKSHTVEYPMSQPKNGWAEQDPLDWYNAVIKTLKAVTDGIDASKIAGIGISGQMHSTVMLDKDNNVIRPAILWCDGRTAKECEEITERVGKERLIEITANPALTGFSASKILWVRNNEPQNYAKCAHILLAKDYIRFRLTGVYATDVSDASGMQLLDIKNRCWSDEVLHKLEIDKSMLAAVYESPDITGYTTKEIEALTGILQGTPVVGGAGDNAAAAVGTGVVENGRAFTTIGTSGVVFAHTKDMHLDKEGRVHTFCAAVPGEWHVMGVTLSAGQSLKWFRDNFCAEETEQAKADGVDTYYLMDNEAKDRPIGANGLIFVPYLMGERTPHLDPDCRGAFVGISGMHTRADFIRAVMEGVIYSLRDCSEVLKEMGISPTQMAACGGGAVSGLWRTMLSDVLDVNVCTMSSKEGPALGAAILAGVGAGVYGSVQEACQKVVKKVSVCEPDIKNHIQYEKVYQMYKKIYPALKMI